MPDFNTYFSTENIIACVWRRRLTVASRRHEQQFLRNLTDAVGLADATDEAIGLLPPRRLWPRSGAPAVRIARTLSLMAEHPDAPWAHNLRRFVERVRNAALGPNPYLLGDRTIRCLKKPNCNGYRVVAAYNLLDSVIGSLTTRYLRDRLDIPARNHQRAFARVLRFKEEHAKQRMWISEADIQSFYDVVHHDVVRDALCRACEGRDVDVQAIGIVEAVLGSYTFSRDGLADGIRWLTARGIEGRIPWPEDELGLFWDHPRAELIGVAQGHPLSGLLVDIVLAQADRAVLVGALRKADTDALMYERVCDDIIIVSTDHGACERAFRRYCSALNRLSLPIHPAHAAKYRTRGDVRRFWGAKTKRPYLWARKCDGGIPWLSFVGYQVRHDGRVRIRPASIAKHVERIEAEILRVERSFARAHARNRVESVESFVIRTHARLVAMATGRNSHSNRCWADGFRLLGGQPHDAGQLRKLDRVREHAVRTLRHRLLAMGYRGHPRHVRRDSDRYFGPPTSYFARFRR